jgi:carboxylesterase
MDKSRIKPMLTGSLIAVLLFFFGSAGYNTIIDHQINRWNAAAQRDPQTGILIGAEPIYLEGTNGRAVLLLHGFIGSPTDYGRLPHLLHERGFTVSAPLLAGHGTDPRDFATTTTEDLLNSAREAWQRLARDYDEVTVVGFSMGGALAVVLSQELSLKRLVLIAPYFDVAHQWYYLLPTAVWQRVMRPWVPYVYRPAHFKQINKRDQVDQIIDYDYVSLAGSAAALELAQRACAAVSEIKIPLLTVLSRGDQATASPVTEELLRRLPSEQVQWHFVERSNHVLLWDYDADSVEQAVLEFVD